MDASIKGMRGKNLHNRIRTGSLKSLGNINKARREAKLSDLKIITRKCLKCERDFESYGANHRMCDGCGVYYANRQIDDEGCLVTRSS